MFTPFFLIGRAYRPDVERGNEKKKNKDLNDRSSEWNVAGWAW